MARIARLGPLMRSRSQIKGRLLETTLVMVVATVRLIRELQSVASVCDEKVLDYLRA